MTRDLSALAAASRAFYAGRGERRGPASLEELRALRAGTPPPVAVDPPAAEELATADGRSVPVRVHHPAGEPTGVVLALRGGGFFSWSAAPDDCETAALWLGSRFGALPRAVLGFSAGSTLAVTTLVRLRDRGAPSFEAAALQFGAWDLSGRTPGGRRYADEWFIRAYAGSADLTQPDISPAYADLAGLPPVFLVVGDSDVLHEDNEAWLGRRLDPAIRE